MMMTVESAMTARLPAGANFFSSSALHHCRLTWSSEEVFGSNIGSQRRIRRGGCDMPGKRFQRSNSGYFSRTLTSKGIRAATENLGSASDPNGRSNYHPFEEIVDSASKSREDARLTAAETVRTAVEVNRKASLLFTGMIDDEIHENIVWPDLPYVTDEHGNIYFQVENNEDVLKSLTLENNVLQCIIGFDTMALLKEIQSSGSSEIEFGIENIEDLEYDVDVDIDIDDDDNDEDDEDEDEDDDDEEWVNVLEDEDDESDSEESVGDWAKLDTMRSSHPMYFAKKLSEVASNDPVDWMEQPPAGLAIQGILRPALIEEQSDIKKLISSNQMRIATNDTSEKIVEDKVDIDIISGQGYENDLSENGSTELEGSETDEIPTKEASFFKLEMNDIQLITADGHQMYVELEDYQKAQPDAIGHAASKIITRLKAGGEKTIEALKSLCWRCKGIQVEEATLISVDSLGFDLRVCSGTQIQTLRFGFHTRATSEYSAERQLNDLLFPRMHQKGTKTETGSPK